MTISYSTNWMGPVSLNWYKERNLTTIKTVMFKGQLVQTTDITQRWSGGRIDVRGEGLDPYGDEIGLPVMRDDCWRLFSDWLDTFETDDAWTLDQLVEMYERSNPKIIWANDVFGDKE